jgi:hypothetical protein
MTIETKVETAFSARARGFAYVQSAAVAVVSVVSERRDPSIPLRAAMQASAARFEVFLRACRQVLPQHRILLFVATPFSHQYNALSERRGVWGDGGLKWISAVEGSRSTSVQITGRQGAVCFAGLSEVTNEEFFEAVDFARTHDRSYLFLSPRRDMSEERVRAIAAKAFPAGDTGMAWAGIVSQVEDGEEICIRASGGFDDREVAIDAFLSDDLRRKVGPP